MAHLDDVAVLASGHAGLEGAAPLSLVGDGDEAFTAARPRRLVTLNSHKNTRLSDCRS